MQTDGARGFNVVASKFSPAFGFVDFSATRKWWAAGKAIEMFKLTSRARAALE